MKKILTKSPGVGPGLYVTSYFRVPKRSGSFRFIIIRRDIATGYNPPPGFCHGRRDSSGRIPGIRKTPGRTRRLLFYYSTRRLNRLNGGTVQVYYVHGARNDPVRNHGDAKEFFYASRDWTGERRTVVRFTRSSVIRTVAPSSRDDRTIRSVVGERFSENTTSRRRARPMFRRSAPSSPDDRRMDTTRHGREYSQPVTEIQGSEPAGLFFSLLKRNGRKTKNNLARIYVQVSGR